MGQRYCRMENQMHWPDLACYQGLVKGRGFEPKFKKPNCCRCCSAYVSIRRRGELTIVTQTYHRRWSDFFLFF